MYALTRRIAVMAGASLALLLGVGLGGGRVVGQLRGFGSRVARNVRAVLAASTAVRDRGASHQRFGSSGVARLLPQVVEGNQLVLKAWKS